MEEGNVTKGVLYFRCYYTDGSEEPGWFSGAAVMKDNIGEVKRFLREDKQFAKPALRCYKLKILRDMMPDPEVERLSAEHDVESAAAAEKKKAAKGKKGKKVWCVFPADCIIVESSSCLILRLLFCFLACTQKAKRGGAKKGITDDRKRKAEVSCVLACLSGSMQILELTLCSVFAGTCVSRVTL